MISTEQLAVVEQRIANENKSTALAYVLWFFTGLLGIHNFYIGRTKLGVVELICGFGGFVLLASRADTVLAVIMVSTWGLLLLIDLFTIPSGIKNYRAKLRAQYIAEFASDGTPVPLDDPPAPSGIVAKLTGYASESRWPGISSSGNFCPHNTLYDCEDHSLSRTA
jgi:hypothetical protein